MTEKEKAAEWKCFGLSLVGLVLTLLIMFCVAGFSHGAVASSPVNVKTLSALRALSPGAYQTVFLQGCTASGDGCQGSWYWSATATTADNIGTVVRPNSNPSKGRWFRLYSDYVKPEWFGGGVSVLDNYTAIVAAYTAFPVVQFSAGTYRYDSTITMTATQNSISFRGSGRGQTILQYTGSSDGIRMGGNINQVVIKDLRLYSTTGADAIRIHTGTTALTLSATGYTNAIAGDVGKTVVGGATGATGILTAYDNGTRVWTISGYGSFMASEQLSITTGTGAGTLSSTFGPVNSDPDGGVLEFSRLDIRGWLGSGIKSRLTVDLHTEDLEIVEVGGTGIVHEYCSPRATTWKDDNSWVHVAGGHGITMEGPFSVTLAGTIVDSDLGVSTALNVIRYAGYTLALDTTGYTACAAADIGMWVRRAGVTVGRLAHYDNTSREWIVDAVSTIAAAGALTLNSKSDGTGTAGTGAGTGTTSQKNSHGLYAKTVTGLSVLGGHSENHLYGYFLDNVYDSKIDPGYVLTQGAGAWGLYFASTCTRVESRGVGIDVQAGGAGDTYIGPLARVTLSGGHGASGYNFVNRSANSIVTTALNASPVVWSIQSDTSTPVQVVSTNATGLLGFFSNTAGGTAYSGLRLQVSGFLKDIYTDYLGDFVFGTSGLGKELYLLGSGSDRANQRINWTTNDKTIPIMDMGPTSGQMTGSNVEANFAVRVYSDAGALLDTALSISRSTYVAKIPAGKATATKASIGGSVFQTIGNVGNVTTAETDLFNYSIKANMLARNGDLIRVTCGGTTAANANTKRFKAYFGAATGLNTGAIAYNNSQWNAEIFLQRLTATTQLMIVRFYTNDALLYSYSQTTTATETLSGDVALRFTATATATNDIVLNGAQAKWEPGL